MKQTIILIPPSEGKHEGGNHPALQKVSSITQKLLDEINSFPEQQKLLGVKGLALDKAIAANKNVLSSPTMKAIERYKGVVYDGIDYPTFKNASLFDKRVRIVSALFGLISPIDRIPNYKLKIDKLRSGQRWLEHNSALLKNCFVIDLLPQAHKKAVAYTNGVEVEFIIEKNGKKLPAGHQGKFIKGRFVRWLIEHDITDTKDFSKFSEEGFVWDGKKFIKKIKK